MVLLSPPGKVSSVPLLAEVSQSSSSLLLHIQGRPSLRPSLILTKSVVRTDINRVVWGKVEKALAKFTHDNTDLFLPRRDCTVFVSSYGLSGVFPKCFSLNSANLVTKKFMTLKGLKPAISCVRDQHAYIDVNHRHIREKLILIRISQLSLKQLMKDRIY